MTTEAWSESPTPSSSNEIATPGRARNGIWIRRGLFGLVCIVPVLALFNVFGQHPDTSAGSAAAASLSVTAPSRVRGGLLYQARFNITARKKLAQAELVLARGWIHDLTINTMEPSPTSETSQEGKLASLATRSSRG